MSEDALPDLPNRKRAYTHIRNYLANELGFTREAIESFLKKTVREHVFAWMEHHRESYWLKGMISQAVAGGAERVAREIMKDKISVKVNVEVAK